MINEKTEGKFPAATGLLLVETELLSLVKVEDFYKDGGSALKRTLKKGKGKPLNIDSVAKGNEYSFQLSFSDDEDHCE